MLSDASLPGSCVPQHIQTNCCYQHEAYKAPVSDHARGLQADVVEATSNALLGVAGMSLDPSLGPIMSPRPVPVLITTCIHSQIQCLCAAKLVAAVLAVFVMKKLQALQPGMDTIIAVRGCLHSTKAVVGSCWLMHAS